MNSYESSVADSNGPINRRRTVACRLAVGVALALAGVCVQAADGASVVIQSDLIGLDIRPDGVSNGGANQINHVPAPENPAVNDGSSQALVIDFGQDVQVIEARLGGLKLGETNENCTEVGRWTAFDAAGGQLGSDTFAAGPSSANGVAFFTEEPLRYLAFSAEPYRDCDRAAVGSSDSSDYLIKRLSFRFEDQAEYDIPNDSGTFVAPLAPGSFLAYDPDEPFIDDNGNLVDPEGERLGATVIVIEPEKCEGGTGSGSADSCDIELVEDRFTSTFENAGDIEGTLAVRAIKTIDDSRSDCAYPGSSGDAGKLFLNSELEVVATESDAAIIIPSYLCGIPVEGEDNGTSVPRFTVIELESTLTVRESFITHVVENPHPEAFDCGLPDHSRQPVIGWLPRADEIPVIGPDGTRSRTMEDVTIGCGSTRGSTFRMSYLLFDLRHLPGTDYPSVVAGEFRQLRATFMQLAACVNNGTLTSTMESSVDKAARWFGNGQLGKARGELSALRSKVKDFSSRLGRDLPSCFWNAPGQMVVAADREAPGEGLAPRNARGDLLTQIDHILYMIDSKFDGGDDAGGAQNKGKGKNKKD